MICMQLQNNEIEETNAPNTFTPELFEGENTKNDFPSSWKLDVTERVKRNFVTNSKSEASFDEFSLEAQPEFSLSLEDESFESGILQLLNDKSEDIEIKNSQKLHKKNAIFWDDAKKTAKEVKINATIPKKVEESQEIDKIVKKDMDTDEYSPKDKSQKVFRPRFSKKDDKGNPIFLLIKWNIIITLYLPFGL